MKQQMQAISESNKMDCDPNTLTFFKSIRNQPGIQYPIPKRPSIALFKSITHSMNNSKETKHDMPWVQGWIPNRWCCIILHGRFLCINFKFVPHWKVRATRERMKQRNWFSSRWVQLQL